MAGTCEALTIEENMALAWKRGAAPRLRLLAQPRPARAVPREARILKLGLENRLADRIGLLSGGQRQAVSLLMASLQPSRILLLDEHTAALDPKTAAFVLELTARIVEAGKLTAMMVTHSMRQALDYGTRTVMLHEGRVILDVAGPERKGHERRGPAAHVREDPRREARRRQAAAGVSAPATPAPEPLRGAAHESER